MKQYWYKTQQIESILNKLVNYTSEMSLDPDIIYQTLSGAGMGVKHSLEGAGHAIENILKGEQETFAGLDNLLKGPVQLLINLIVFLLIIVAIGYIAYIMLLRYQKKLSIQKNVDYNFGSALMKLSRLSKTPKENQGVRFQKNNENVEFLEQTQSINLVEGTMRKAPHIDIFINRSVKAKALVDTGAVFSLMDVKFIDKLDDIKIWPTNLTPIAANGEKISLCGATQINISFGDVDENLAILIQENCASDVILGTNFLGKFRNINFNWEKSCINFNNKEIEATGMNYNSLKDKSKIYLDEFVILEPNSETMISVQIPDFYAGIGVGIIRFKPL